MSNPMAIAEMEGRIDWTRGRDWLDPTTLDPIAHRICMIGAGGIGSTTSLLLAKLGVPRIDLIDFDDVERHNLPNQFFPLDAVGQSKVDALADTLEEYSTCDVYRWNGRVTEEGVELEEGSVTLSGLIVSALDSMEARKNLWGLVKRNVRTNLLIDARLGGEAIVVHAINPLDSGDIERYEETLYSDEEAVPLPCTRQAVIDVGGFVASIITNTVRKFWAGKDVPWRIYLNADSMNIYQEWRTDG